MKKKGYGASRKKAVIEAGERTRREMLRMPEKKLLCQVNKIFLELEPCKKKKGGHKYSQKKCIYRQSISFSFHPLST